MDDPSIPRFVDLYPDWKQDAAGTFADYTERTLNPERYGVVPNAAPGKSRAEHTWTLFADETPLLPPITEFRLKKHKEQIMRAFLNMHWGAYAAADISETCSNARL